MPPSNPLTRYVGAEPVFIGCDDSLCIDPDGVDEFCRTRSETRDGKLYNKATGAHVKALEVVHVFGNMADMARLTEIARRYGLILIEDATEALGTRYTDGPFAGKYAGTIGDIGCYSFNGNKIITTGAGRRGGVQPPPTGSNTPSTFPPRPRPTCCSSCMTRWVTTTA